MSDRPKRLWLSAPDADNEHEVWFDPDEGGTEYIRADLTSEGEAAKPVKGELPNSTPHPMGWKQTIIQEIWSRLEGPFGLMGNVDRRIVEDGMEIAWTILRRHGFRSMDPAPQPAQPDLEVVAWVIPGRDNANDRGFLDAMAWEDGEFSSPLVRLTDAQAALTALRAERERLERERDEALDAPWPKWAEQLRLYLQGFGVDPGDEWDLPEQYEDWLNEVVRIETEKAEARVAGLEKALNWALGCGDDFPAREDGQGAFWWRTELAERAGLIYDKDAGRYRTALQEEEGGNEA